MPNLTWSWRAIYDDGSTISEHDVDGDHSFYAIDLKRIRALELLPAVEGQPAFSVLINPAKNNQRPIFFRTMGSPWLYAGGENEELMTCIGRQETVHGTNVSTYVLFDAQGHIVIADSRNALGA